MSELLSKPVEGKAVKPIQDVYDCPETPRRRVVCHYFTCAICN
jgi:hypothetical protein